MTQQTCSNCGANFEDQQFCPDCGQWVDPLDETHFEEFTLGDSPPAGDDDPMVTVSDVSPIRQMINCPSCGAANPEHNRHCEECGARITQGPLPVAPQPMIRTTAGARALAVILGVVAVVAVDHIDHRTGCQLAAVRSHLRDLFQHPGNRLGFVRV